MKHSYICYAAVSEDGESIFEHRNDTDADSGEHLEWFDEWQFKPELIPDCAYADGWQEILQEDLKRLNVDARIKRFKITVEELADSD